LAHFVNDLSKAGQPLLALLQPRVERLDIGIDRWRAGLTDYFTSPVCVGLYRITIFEGIGRLSKLTKPRASALVNRSALLLR
jgi:hypothetical protein